MEYMEFKGKTKNDAITEACKHFSVPSDKLDYEVIDEGKTGFLGMGSRPAFIKARVKEEKEEVTETVELLETLVVESVPVDEAKSKDNNKNDIVHEDIDVEAVTKKFLADVFAAMGISVEITVKYEEEPKSLDVDLNGDEMGVLIGKRGQTLDSLQYLISLVVNKGTTEYIRVKVDTENYRQRRKETLENLAKNISYKVKRTRRPVSLEPMNPYERRIIHSALQNDKYVTTHSEGEEPFRRVVVTPKKDSNYNDAKGYRGNRNYNNGYHKGYSGNYNCKNKENNRERTENHTEAVE
ncbi:MAG TPA: protein jag [Lachnospiraceae bacterium]|jgi:spoIIIJ-associated protein|nr:protein jag [Lachnospiraceae bacterium]